MPLHLQREIDRLKKELLTLCGMVEANVAKAIRALVDRESTLAESVIETDRKIDAKEIEVEEDTLKIIALHQPVAFDLRFLSSALRINRDLERIGDIAVNIAHRALYLNKQVPVPRIHPQFAEVAEIAQQMLKDSLDALVQLDTDKARNVCRRDEDVDRICTEMFEHTKQRIRENPEDIDVLSHLLMLPRRIERIADHATNISEDLVYMVEGEIVRHDAEMVTNSGVQAS